MTGEIEKLSSLEERLAQALSEALALIGDRLGEEFEPQPNVMVCPDSEGLAWVSWSEDGATVAVSKSCVRAIETLWSDSSELRVLLDADGAKLRDPKGDPLDLHALVHHSLVWLILHELMHVRLGHLDLLSVSALSESDLETREAKMPEWVNGLNPTERTLLRPCLELQADDDATDVFFGLYDENEWNRFRVDAAAVFVVMSVMERSEAERNSPRRTYPRVATRFFTLFARLFQFWLYGDAELIEDGSETFVRPAREPSGEDFQRYMKFVVALALNDAIQIALMGGAKSLMDDLGAGEDFFSDLFEIQYADDLDAAVLKTEAAQEWRSLLPVNEKAMKISGLRDG